MVSRVTVARSLRVFRPSNNPRTLFCRHVSTPSSFNKQEGEKKEIPLAPPPPRQISWMARKMEQNETFRWFLLKVAGVMGYQSTKQIAGRRCFGIYQDVGARAPEIDAEFWYNECDLPPTFQSWFTVTTLHMWMLTVRCRALPPPEGKYYVQFLLDHYFIDVEDRIRAILQPPDEGPANQPYTFFSDFYVNPNAPAVTPEGKRIKRGQAPERIVMRQLKLFHEQWMGMTMALDLSLIRGDAEMAAAIWRNLLGARGASGFTYDPAKYKFHRAINLVGSEANPRTFNFEKEESRDDGSGVFDYPPEQVDKYVQYPALMYDIVAYVRRELSRLESVNDDTIINGDWNQYHFGKVRPPGSPSTSTLPKPTPPKSPKSKKSSAIPLKETKGKVIL